MAFGLFGQAVTVIITITPSGTVLSPRFWTVHQCEILGLTVISSGRIFFRRQGEWKWINRNRAKRFRSSGDVG